MLNVKKLMYKVLNTLLGVLGIGTVTVSGTTTAQGAMNISSYIPTNAIPFAAEVQSRTAFVSFYGSSWIRLATWDGSGIANTQITMKIYYVKKVGGVLRNLSIFKAFSNVKPSERMVVSC